MAKILSIFCFLLLAAFTHQNLVKRQKFDTRTVYLPSSKYEGVRPYALVNITGEELFVSTFKTSLENAMMICNEMELSLVAIDTEEKNKQLQDFIDDFQNDFGWEYWTSGRRMNDDWQWTSNGKMFTFYDFYDYQPHPERKDECVSINIVFEWQNNDCMNEFRFICQHW